MTLAGPGFDPAADRDRSRRAAIGHHHQSSVWGLGRVEWTRGNIVRLIALVATTIVVLSTVVMCGVSFGRAEAGSRLVVEEYFAATQRADERRMADLSCPRTENPLAEQMGLGDPFGFDDVTAVLRTEGSAELDWSIDPHYGDADVRYHDFEIEGRLRGTVFLKPSTGSRQWLVCGFLELEVPHSN